MSSSPADLLRQFLHLTDPSRRDEDNPSPLWERVWKLFLEHAWFQQQLRWCAEQSLGNRLCNRQLADDVYQEVAGGLARKFQWKADLNFKRGSTVGEFAKWLRSILARDCYSAAKKVLVDFRPLTEEPAVHDPDTVEVMDTLEVLTSQDRKILELYLQGYTFREIEQELELSYWTVRRVVFRWGRNHLAA